MPWRTIHAYYHEDDTDELVLEAVRPLFERLAGDVPEAYFVPHWRRGPHLRLIFRTDEATFDELVFPQTQRIVGGFLREHPSTTRLDPEEILPLHERLARLENERGPLRPWQPNNTITAEEHESREHVVGNADTAELLARFYVDTTGLTFEMLAATANRSDRRRLAFALMLATVHAFSVDGLARDFVTFRSHTEAFLSGAPGGAQHREAWDAQYARGAEHFEVELKETLATVEGHRDSVPFVNRWIATLRPIEQAARDLLGQGRLYMPTADLSRAKGLSSEFHRALAASPEALARLQTDWFTVFRAVLNYMYLHLTRLGLSAAERHALCHIAANTAERHYGTTARDLVAAGGASA